MKHFALVALPYRGHLDPMLALGSELKRRGHRVSVLHIADAGALVRSRRHDFLAVGRASHPSGWLVEASDRLGRASGLANLAPIMRDFAGLTAMLCDELPAALRAIGADMIVSDQFEAAGGMVAYRLGLPFVSLAAALPLNWDSTVPSPFVGWRPGSSRWRRARNVATYVAAARIRAPISAVIDDYATRWRLGLPAEIESYLSGLAQIAQLVPSLDFPRKALSGCFHYCGPLRSRSAPVPRSRGTRRALVSLGSLQGHRLDRLETMARAARAAGYAPVVAHGGRLNADQAKSLGRIAEVHAFVAQDEVLAQCDLALLHGGLNTVLDAATHGVPTVVRPIAFEQAAIAARVEQSGAGLACRSWPPGNLNRVTREVGDTPAFALAAARLASEIALAGGAMRAADIVETVAATGRPVHNAQGLAQLTGEAPLDDHRYGVTGLEAQPADRLDAYAFA